MLYHCLIVTLSLLDYACAMPCWPQSRDDEILLVVYDPKNLKDYGKWVTACEEVAKTLRRKDNQGPAYNCKSVRLSWHGCNLKSQDGGSLPYLMWGPAGSSNEADFSSYKGLPNATAISEFVTSQRDLFEAVEKAFETGEAYTDGLLGHLYRVSQPTLFWREHHPQDEIKTAQAIISGLWGACDTLHYGTLQDYYVHSDLGNTAMMTKLSKQLDDLIARGKLCRLWTAFYHNFKSSQG